MIKFSHEDINAMHHLYRINLINSCSGFKSANLIGTKSKSGISNVAVFSSVTHLGSDPAILGFFVRPTTVLRNTYENILETKSYTINHIHTDFIENAHYTSAKFDKDESEFDKCNFTEEFLFDFQAPFVKESRVKLAMQLEDMLPIELNNCMMVIGSIQHLWIDDMAVEDDGQINLELLNDVGIGGLNSYYRLERIGQFPYARANELPDFR